MPAQASLVVTVRDEEHSIARLLDSIVRQTVQPAEVIVVDGGSKDRTPDIVRAYSGLLPIKLIERPGANIARGRNEGIRAASYEIVAVTDAGVRLDPHWLEALLVPLLDSGSDTDVAAGFFLPDPHTPFEMAMGATVLPAPADVRPDKFLPSSRSVAFRREAWWRAGGYPEWLDYCEDLVFDFRLKAAGCRFKFVPEAVVYFRPRSNLKAFFVQYYRYARGDGKADLWRGRHAIRYSVYTAASLLVALAYRNRHEPWAKGVAAMLALAGAAYCRRPYQRLWPMLKVLPLPAKLYALALVPVIRLVGDVAKMLGYPVGVWWRLKM
jgi:glycosyltransferase involved in cell wall biosynthesis